MKFKLFGCKINIRFYFVASLTIMLLFFPQRMLLFGITAAFLHEFGHIAAILAYKQRIRELDFSPFGIRMVREYTIETNYNGEIWISLAGPLFNLSLSLFSYMGAALFSSSALLNFAALNLCLGLFNLLPILPLDGGTILHILLCKIFPESMAGRISNVMTVLWLLPLACMGFFLLLQSGYNASLLITSVYLIAFLLLHQQT